MEIMTEPAVKDILIRARSVIEHPQNWTQGAWGRDEEGSLVWYTSERAVCWCAEGAIKLAAGRRWESYRAAIHAFEKFIPPQMDGTANVTNFNDTHSHDDVLAIFDEAIGAA